MEPRELEKKFDAGEGLQALLAVPEIGKMHGVLPTVDFLQQAIDYAIQERETAKASPHVARVWGGYVRIAEQLLVIERQRAPILNSPLDAEPRMWRDPETGQSYVVVGGGPQEGGYAAELHEDGENRMVWR